MVVRSVTSVTCATSNNSDGDSDGISKLGIVMEVIRGTFELELGGFKGEGGVYILKNCLRGTYSVRNVEVRRKMNNPVIMKKITTYFTKYGLCPSGHYIMKK